MTSEQRATPSGEMHPGLAQPPLDPNAGALTVRLRRFLTPSATAYGLVLVRVVGG